jgi:hypothetical protein
MLAPSTPRMPRARCGCGLRCLPETLFSFYRNIVVGALLAAESGVEGIPDTWKTRTQAYAEVSELADQVVAHL